MNSISNKFILYKEIKCSYFNITFENTSLHKLFFFQVLLLKGAPLDGAQPSLTPILA